MSKKINTVEYFPHFANASSKMTLTILEKKYGVGGYAAWFKLLECLAQSDGHFIKCETPLQIDYLTSRLSVGNGHLINMLQDMADLSAIDKELWDKQRIIWSDNFLENVKVVYTNRKRSPPQKPLFYIEPTNNLQATYSLEERRGEERKGNKEGDEKSSLPPENLKEPTLEKIDDDGNPITTKQEVIPLKLDAMRIPTDIKSVFSFLDKQRGYRPPKRKAEAASILRMLKTYSVEQITQAWQSIKQDKFFQDKELYMMTVESQIGARINGNHQNSPTTSRPKSPDDLFQR